MVWHRQEGDQWGSIDMICQLWEGTRRWERISLVTHYQLSTCIWKMGCAILWMKKWPSLRTGIGLMECQIFLASASPVMKALTIVSMEHTHQMQMHSFMEVWPTTSSWNGLRQNHWPLNSLSWPICHGRDRLRTGIELHISETVAKSSIHSLFLIL